MSWSDIERRACCCYYATYENIVMGIYQDDKELAQLLIEGLAHELSSQFTETKKSEEEEEEDAVHTVCYQCSQRNVLKVGNCGANSNVLPGRANSTMHFKDNFKKLIRSMSSKHHDSLTTTPQQISSKQYEADNLVLTRTLGTGSFGRVFLAQVKGKDGNPSGEVVAVKRLTKTDLIRQKQVQHVAGEKEILSSIQHPFIVNLRNTYQDQAYLYLVMEFVQGGEFFVYLRKRKRLEPKEAQFYTACVAETFRYLHERNIVFRDLKPENILIDATGYLKLTDFGFAKRITSRTYTLCGTPEYIAPEILLNKGHGKPVDWWTLGILIYEMLTGYPPFTDEDTMRIYQKILSGRLLFPRGFPREPRSLVKHLLAHDITCRYGELRHGSLDVFEHRWLSDINMEALRMKSIQAPYVPSLTSAADDSHFHRVHESDAVATKIVGAEDPFNNW